MAVVAGVLSERQKRTLDALCDTWVPAVDPDGSDPVEASFLARPAADIGVADQIEDLMADAMTPDEIAATGELLDALADEDFADLTLDARADILSATAASSFDARHGLHALKGLTLMFFYALPDAAGHEPELGGARVSRAQLARPPPAEAPKTIRIEDVQGAAATLTADVCVVGSGAGGAVIAAGCAAAGLSVLVLEMGSYRNESDFKQLEIPGMFELYLGGGLLTSENGSIAVLAGSTLGGGTVVNYMNCIRTPQHIRDEWAQHGLEGIDAPEYERDHIDAVSERLGTNTEMTRQNGTHQLLMQGLDALGLEHRPIVRNAAPDDDPEFCGYCSMGCQHGCKRSTMKTWLQDASDAGARCVVQCRADRVLVEDGRAVGVAATVTRDDGSETALTVEAPTVVVACGGVESPALLLRSEIGGPAVGKHLRLHPGVLGERHLRRSGRGLARPAPVARVGLVRRARGRLRLPDRGDGHLPRPLGRIVAVVRRRRPQAPDGEAAVHGSLHQRAARPRERRGRARRPGARGRALGPGGRGRPAGRRARERRAGTAAPRRGRG